MISLKKNDYVKISRNEARDNNTDIRWIDWQKSYNFILDDEIVSAESIGAEPPVNYAVPF